MTKREALTTTIAILSGGISGSVLVEVLRAQKPAPDLEKPKQRELPDLDASRQQSVTFKRSWVVSDRMIKILALKPATQEGYFGPIVLGEDGHRYLLDDVLYGLLTVIEHHLFPETTK